MTRRFGKHSYLQTSLELITKTPAIRLIRITFFYGRSVGKKARSNICEGIQFPQRGKYPQVTNICQIRKLWEIGLKL
jgi:hypothetical protein